ncbi:ABC transporter substrate-binding protein [Paenibacillus wulumuqiensis]|uniref:ABC transporter substrate-binding protein n=1 Tax=Paenibacillus wulumuqiensis TaxID=1567107 RepID=UPI00061948B9|nr:ABC transporter substrate-binding protein [Paenibacillus wulumuqiensis]
MAEDYMRLRRSFTAHGDEQMFSVTMEQLAGALFCTPRNARLILSRMTEAGWIAFQPGRGRGNRSVLSFLRPAADVMLEEARARVTAGDVQAAFDWVHEYESVAAVREAFLPWLTSYFGYSAERSDSEQMVETLRLPIYRPIVCLDPADAVFAFDTEMIEQLYSRLTGYDTAAERVTAGLAHHWECSGEGTVWTFYLLKNTSFHSGQELTAEDVAVSLERLRTDAHAHSWLVEQVDEVRVVNRYAVQIVLHRPNMYFDLYMSHTGASIVPTGGHPVAELPVGSGAYRITSRQPGRCVLERFSGYYGRSALIDRIEIMIVPEQEAEYAMGPAPGTLTVITGEVSIQPPSDLLRQQNVTGVSLLSVNRRKPGILQDRWLRQALVHGIDRTRMIHELGDTRVAAASGLHLTSRQHNLHTYEDRQGEANMDADGLYDPQQALQSLRYSGYEGELLHLYTFQRHERDACWLQASYGKLGIRIEVHIVPWAELSQPHIREQADLILFEAVLSGGMLRQLEYVHSVQSLLRSRLSDNAVERIDVISRKWLCSRTSRTDAGTISESSREQEIRQMAAWLQQIETILLGDCSIVPLVERSAILLHHPSLRGVRINERGWTNFQQLWFCGN